MAKRGYNAHSVSLTECPISGIVPGLITRSLMTGLIAIVPVIVVVLMLADVRSLQANSSTGIGSLNAIGVFLSCVLVLLALLLIVELWVGAIRDTIENRALFDPTGTARLLLTHRNLIGSLLLTLAFLGLIAVLTTSIGLVLLILLGLVVGVCCSLAL